MDTLRSMLNLADAWRNKEHYSSMRGIGCCRKLGWVEPFQRQLLKVAVAQPARVGYGVFQFEPSHSEHPDIACGCCARFIA